MSIQSIAIAQLTERLRSFEAALASEREEIARLRRRVNRLRPVTEAAERKLATAARQFARADRSQRAAELALQAARDTHDLTFAQAASLRSSIELQRDTAGLNAEGSK